MVVWLSSLDLWVGRKTDEIPARQRSVAFGKTLGGEHPNNEWLVDLLFNGIVGYILSRPIK
jgi:hypothetical protein